jgi:hypothetical protein
MSEEGTTSLNSDDMVHCLMNHIENKSFSTLSDFIIKMEQVDNLETRNFANSLLQELKKYQIKNKKLPDSFSPKNIRALYLNLKA